MRTFYVNVHDLFKFEVIDTVNSPAFHHLKKQYRNFIVDNIEGADLEIRLVKHDKSMKKYGSKIAQWSFRVEHKDSLDIAYISSNIGGSRFLKKYIIESLMMRKLKIPFLHASAIAGNKAFVFAGRSATGKTVCAMGLYLLSKEISYLSDDWVLIKGGKVLPYSFPVALHHQHLGLFKDFPYLLRHVSFKDRLAIRGFQILEPVSRILSVGMYHLRVPHDITLKQKLEAKQIGGIAKIRRDLSQEHITVEKADDDEFFEDLARLTIKEFYILHDPWSKYYPMPKIQNLKYILIRELESVPKLKINFPFRLKYPLISFKSNLVEDLEKYYLEDDIMEKVGEDKISREQYYKKEAMVYDKRFRTFSSKLYDKIEKELVFEFVRKHNKILDAGSGTGRFAIYLAKQGKDVTALDYSNEMLDILEEKARGQGVEVKTINGDLRNMNLGEKFEAIVSMRVVGRFEDVDVLFREYNKALEVDGLLVFELHSPFWLGVFRAVMGKKPKGRKVYTLSSNNLNKILAKHGFKVVKVKRYRILPSFVCEVIFGKLKLQFLSGLLYWAEKNLNIGGSNLYLVRKVEKEL